MLRLIFVPALGLALSVALAAQTPPAQTPPAQAPAAPRPAGQPPATPRPAARPAATTLSFQLTDALGAPLPEVQVTTQSPVARDGVTGSDGSLRFANMRAGTYRVRFARTGSITLERDVTVRAGESLAVDVSLSPAPLAAKAPEPMKPAAPEPSTKALPPPGEPKVTAIPAFLEKNFIGRDPRKESDLGCTPTATATLHQLREAWLNHTHDDADEWIYVVAGEGTLRIGTADQRVTAGTFSLVPHTIGHALLPSGRNPLIVISVLSGPPCAGPK
ncbi:MAG: carboxypeptidase regulatory-like domain-containing protein [Vicinamibacterales bacterium]|nr:carboxypeptidase regulatory-like domain-containing protein [Vicinamibacterales bacterium]